MNVERNDLPLSLENSTFDITGLSYDEARFLRDLTGRFADNPGDGGIASHFHTHLFAQLDKLLNYPHRRVYRIWAYGHHDTDVVLHCSKEGDDD